MSYLSLFFVEFIVVAREALHGDEEVPQSCLELLPVVAVVEQVYYKRLYLNTVQVGEQSVDAINEKIDNKLLIGWELVRLSILIVDVAKYDVVTLDNSNELLQNSALQFESSHVSIVCHDRHQITYDMKVEVLIEDCCYLWFVNH